MTTVKITREFFGIRYSHAEFGARPDQTHPDMVGHPLSEGKFVVTECDTMTEAYIAAHAAIGTKVAEGPAEGRSMACHGVEVFRAVEHAPVTKSALDGADVLGDPLDEVFGTRSVTMTITASDLIPGIPHFASCKLSSYHPVNGWATPQTIDV